MAYASLENLTFRHSMRTGCTRKLEAGVPFSVVATIMGWSRPTTVRMARRYGHIGQTAQRQAVNVLKGADFETDWGTELGTISWGAPLQ